MTLEEAADRVAIRELIDAYAHCADRRDADAQMALFTADTHFVVYMDALSGEPSMELHSRAELAPVFDDLNRYVATTHFNGQSNVTISGAAATGDQIDHIVDHVSFVIVNVSRADQHTGVHLRRHLAKQIAQRDFVRPRVVIHLEMCLDVGYRRVMHGNQQEIDSGGKLTELLLNPTVLICTR